MWIWWFDQPWLTSGPHARRVQWFPLQSTNSVSYSVSHSGRRKPPSWLSGYSGAEEDAHWDCGPVLREGHGELNRFTKMQQIL